MRSLRFAAGAAAVLAITSYGLDASALDSSVAQGRAQQELAAVESQMLKSPPTSSARFRQPSPAARVAAGEMLMRTRDYERAIETLSKVLELYRQGKVPEAAYADASYLLGESYHKSRQYLSARRHFREILERAARAPYDAYAGRSLSRLVDISLATGDLDSLDWVMARLAQLPTTDASGSLPYARAKAFFAKRDFNAAKSAVNSVPANSDYTLQSQYLLGVILAREAMPTPQPEPEPGAAPVVQPTTSEAPPPRDARFVSAIDQFRKVTRMPAQSSSARHVVDLAWMAIGRLFYETDQLLDSAEAYSHVDRTSPEFSTMLYELAWVYVRLGDYQRAQRALEVLAISAPETLEQADGSLLRADLMLRSGQFDKALTLYRSVEGQYEPLREKVDQFLRSTNDPAVYYDKLTNEELGATDEKLPPVVLQWAREQAEDDHVFTMIDDVSRSRELLKRARKLGSRLNAALSVPTRAKAFPELRAGLEQTLGLLNKVAKARSTLAQGMDDVASEPSAELRKVREERRSLMRRLGWLPVTDGDFQRRDESGDRQWNRISQTLQQLTIEADRLKAIVNGLRRVLREADQHGVTHDPASRERFRLEVEANERDLESYQKQIAQFRDAVELGRAQVGFGDQRYVEDDQVRKRFKEVFAHEVSLAASGHDSSDAAGYAKSVQPLLTRADIAEGRLEEVRTRYEQQALSQAQDLLKKVADEIALLEGYTNNLDGLDQQARLLVGEIAMRNFGFVRDRLKNIVLRADVGIVQEAWEVREEQRVRVRNLQRERAREEQNLNDELREVLDDAEEEDQ